MTRSLNSVKARAIQRATRMVRFLELNAPVACMYSELELLLNSINSIREIENRALLHEKMKARRKKP